MKQTGVKRRPIVNENNAVAILAFAALNPHASSRQVEKRVKLVSDLIKNLTSTQVLCVSYVITSGFVRQ